MMALQLEGQAAPMPADDELRKKMGTPTAPTQGLGSIVGSGFKDMGGGLAFNTNMSGTMANSTAAPTGGSASASPLGLATNPTPGMAVNSSAAPMSTPAPLANEYPNAPSTTGTPQNRLQLATTAFDTLAKSTAPQYTADLREATQKAAGAGNIGSGQLRTTYGNLANQRALSLDTARSNLVNAATTGTIADQQAAEANALGKYNAETGRMGTTGSLDVQKGSLALAGQHEATSAGQNQQQIDLQKQRDAIDAQVKAGTLTLAQAQQKLAELANTQSYGLEGEKLALAKEGQTAATEQAKAALALSEKLGLGGLSVEQQKVEIAKKQQEIEAAYQAKQISLAERNASLNELTQAQNNALNQGKLALDTKGQEQQGAQEAARLQLAKDQLDQTGKQFGLSLAQQKELATLADKTQNRQLDISSAQGQNSLLLELARIMGAKDQNSIDPNFLAAIAKSLGFALPGAVTPKTGTPVQKRADGSEIKPGDPDWKDDPTKYKQE